LNIEITAEAFILLIGLPALAVTLLYLRRRRSGAQLFLLGAFGLYVLLLVAATLLPIDLSPDYRAIMQREAAFSERMNLIPFYFGPYGSLWHSRFMLVSNILLTVPFGLGIGFLARVRPRDLRWLPWAVGFGIEGAQLALGLAQGYPYRVIDINDTLMNALGVALGYGLFWLIAQAALWLHGRAGWRPGGLAGAVVTAAERSLRE
jgi:glycopeptide antibiotics resistance protein